MDTVFGIIAPISTMIAAIMTAVNLGARITGWGFVVFTVGSLAWCAVALLSGQQNLLVTNGVLVLVNGIGVWRWLGRVARHDDGASSAEQKSEGATAPALVAMHNIVGREVKGCEGTKIGKVVGMMAESDSGKIAYAVISVGGVAGVGERLVAMEWPKLSLTSDSLRCAYRVAEISALKAVDPEDWPTTAT
jgi:membrane protein implicated in regulation of membrane protease activity